MIKNKAFLFEELRKEFIELVLENTTDEDIKKDKDKFNYRTDINFNANTSYIEIKEISNIRIDDLINGVDESHIHLYEYEKRDISLLLDSLGDSIEIVEILGISISFVICDNVLFTTYHIKENGKSRLEIIAFTCVNETGLIYLIELNKEYNFKNLKVIY